MTPEASAFQWANFAESTLVEGVAAGDTELRVQPVHAELFPSLAEGQVFSLILWDSTRQVFEICYCTSRSGNALIVTRGEEGTTARAWAAGTYIVHQATAGFFTQMRLRPVPQLVSLSPGFAAVGGDGFTLTLTGLNFTPLSVARWGGEDRPTTYINSTTLQVEISAEDLETGGAIPVTVFTPAPGGGESNALSFLVGYIEVFTESTTWEVPQGVESVDVLVVAGGGGGGGGPGGGGGGGGEVVFREGYPVTPGGSVAIVVGAGGTTTSDRGSPGGDSSFGSLVAKGGGGGGAALSDAAHGGDGGSGGGGGWNSNDSAVGGSSTATEGWGHDGGDPKTGPGNASWNVGGGGGGAGEAGEDGDLGVKPGDGGDGVDLSMYFGTAYGDGGWFGGGGAGGAVLRSGPKVTNPIAAGGRGGGGDTGQPGVANTGGGGGGGGANATNDGEVLHQPGGSGVVIVRRIP